MIRGTLTVFLSVSAVALLLAHWVIPRVTLSSVRESIVASVDTVPLFDLPTVDSTTFDDPATRPPPPLHHSNTLQPERCQTQEEGMSSEGEAKKETRPQDDFDDFVNGEWKRGTSIPDDQTRWGSFMILREDNFQRLKVICEETAASLAAGKVLARGEQLVGKLFSLSSTPSTAHSPAILQLLQEVAQGVVSTETYLQHSAKIFTSLGLASLMHIAKSEDAKNPNLRVPHIFQAGLGLPDKSYYTDRADLWEPYKEYIKAVTALYGHTVDAEALFQFEKTIAEKHLTRTQLRDPDLTYNKKEYATEIQPALPLYFDSLDGFKGASLSYVVVQNNDLLPFHSTFLPTVSPTVLRDQLIFLICDKVAGSGTEEAQALRFNFRGKLLEGQKVQDPQWKKALKIVESYVGDELGKLYVAKHFPSEKQKQCLEMVNDLKNALRSTLTELTWMTNSTKEKALQKLEKFGVKIGVPAEWHSIEGLWEDNLASAASVHEAMIQYYQWDWKVQELAKFYTPPERQLWLMTPQTVNAYYHPEMNEIVFPAGILQPPFFGHPTYEENIGAIGVVIGHEMTHGFDDQGRKYNADGELSDWWEESDSTEFSARSAVVRDHYGAQLVLGKPVNGELTLGENIADIGGLKLALRALKDRNGGQLPSADHLKRFFHAYALIWRMLIRDEIALKFLVIDPHSPAHLRVNAALGHIPEWYNVFDVKESDKLYLPPEKRMNIW